MRARLSWCPASSRLMYSIATHESPPPYLFRIVCRCNRVAARKQSAVPVQMKEPGAQSCCSCGSAALGANASARSCREQHSLSIHSSSSTRDAACAHTRTKRRDGATPRPARTRGLRTLRAGAAGVPSDGGMDTQRSTYQRRRQATVSHESTHIQSARYSGLRIAFHRTTARGLLLRAVPRGPQ